jgi:two-component system CheB/CheR fusion protein
MLERQLKKEIRLVDDLLDVSRISRGTISLRRNSVDLVKIVREAVEEVRPQIDARHQELTLSIPDEPLTVEGDATRLEQVVANLLANSAKFTQPGGRIRIELGREAKDAVIQVIDNGVGMAPELLPSIFDLFVQAERSLERAEGGLGLGLTLARRLTELHGGSIEARSPGLGQGSKFIVRLPVTLHPRLADDAQSLPEPGGGERTSRRILIVDDSVDAAESSAMLLQLNGHKIQVAFDGPSALEAARTFNPEIILLDIGLPGLNGFEVARHLRQSPGGTHALIVALSGYGRAEDRQHSLDAGFDQHLVKPVDLEQLDAVIAAYDGKDAHGLRE